MDYKAETDRLLSTSGAILKRDHKHEVWALPNGSTFVRAKSPSDRRESLADLTTLRRLLGLQQGNGEGERRQKPVKVRTNGHQRERLDRVPVNTALADQLRLAGITEAAKQDEISELRDALFAEQSHSRAVSDELFDCLSEIERFESRLARHCVCFGCRWSAILRRWMRKVMLYD